MFLTRRIMRIRRNTVHGRADIARHRRVRNVRESVWRRGIARARTQQNPGASLVDGIARYRVAASG